MIVVTADQIDSRSTDDAAGGAIAELNRIHGEALVLPADRTAGDEIQLLPRSGTVALEIVLALTRTRRWSVGIGVGTIRRPLGRSVRESTGDAFIAARDAVERAKRRTTRVAVTAEPARTAASDLESLLDLLLALRARRSEAGWELHDLLREGLTQAEAATRLGITPQSASKRARAADLRIERAASAPLARLIDALDGEAVAEQDGTRRERRD